ncbi:MAG: bifunctional (p)ppGpp synthetase/guanosine-3',5'-bis(diphosphate) 3'-pyrophosphohydrolase [Synergistaceae bacterium]|jgi:GTP pyrophosphokinase|nr:bifunctional (p)ppGpp synthetase/guanosine-3',5'-bis(diphosphate) 3'-pyrophosphohydrolase [Synergistaceae bacterium]
MPEIPEKKTVKNDIGLRADNAEMKSILNSVPELSCSGESREMASLRDAFYAQLPETSRMESVRTAWQELWAKSFLYLPSEQMNLLGEAFVFSGRAHTDQKRSSGEPYIIHSLNTALILAEMQLDPATLCAALLHDVLEDTTIQGGELAAAFGEEIVTLVDGVTKLGKLPFMSLEGYQAENLRKMFVVMARDIRVVLIKLADRLHNMRTLGIFRRDKQERIARETLEIFAPLAHRLGIYQIKRDLEDLSFRYLQPEVYNEIRRKVRKKLPEREEVISRGIEMLENRLAQEGIPCKIKGRAKHYYSIYEKMERKKLSIDELYDILAIRVLVDDLSTCYAVLGIVHSIWVPIPGQFDDYIANPKSNMYQSLHTTVMAFGAPMEVQIRTREMNSLAEYGIAAHWLYKSDKGTADSLDAKLMWVRQALEGEGSQEGHDPEEFLELLKSDVLTSEVYVFTPQGKALVLPRGATTIDFAYAVHTEVGNHCVGAMINNRIVPLNTELRNGDIVKIITSSQGTPSRDWMKIVRSTKTRSKIRNYFRQMEKTDREGKIARGWEALDKELKKRNLSTENLEDFTPALNKVARDLGMAGREDLLVAIGTGSAGPSTVAQRLAFAYLQQKHPSDDISQLSRNIAAKRSNFDIIVDGFEGVMVLLANCCEPVPGDAIVGYTTRLRGITVHRIDCPNILNAQLGRTVPVRWDAPSGRFYTTRIRAEATDRDNLIHDVSQVIGQANGSINGLKVTVIDNTLVRMKIELRVRNLEHLYEIVGKLNGVRGMMEVARV